MKLIRCYTRPENIDAIRNALFGLGAPGLSVTEARGIGKPMSQLKTEEGKEALPLPQFKDRICIEVALDDDDLEEIVDALAGVCRTGRLGDGKIFILPVDDVIRIRTNERGVQSLY